MVHPQRRNRRAGVEDRWTKTVRDEHGNETKVPSARDGKGLRWMGRYVDDDGRERTKAFARKVDAKNWLDEQVSSLVTGTFIDPARASITFVEFYEQWSPSQVWEGTSRAVMDQAIKSVTFGQTPMAKLDEHHLQTWVKRMVDDGLAAATVQSRFKCVRTVIRAAMRGRRRVLAYDPCENITLPRATGRMRIPTPAEVKFLLDEAPAGFKAAIALGAFAGARDGEVRGMRGTDVRFLDREVHIERQAGRGNGSSTEIREPKFNSVRTVAVSAGLTEIVAEHMAEHVPGEDPARWLFPGRSELPVSYTVMNGRWRTAREGLDWPVHFHDLRHFFASGLIAAGCDVKTVQHALGHKSAALTLDLYGHLWPDGNDRARKAGETLLAEVLAAPADQLRTGRA